MPKYIGPYKVIKAHNGASTLTFHTGLIQKFVTNNNLFPKQDMKSFYNFSQDDEQEWLIKEITSHRWSNSKELKLEVRWILGDTTWEPLTSCKDLEALDTYLELWGVAQPCNLCNDLHFTNFLPIQRRTLTRYIYQWCSNTTIVRVIVKSIVA